MRKTTKSAFTLVELIVVITILAILGTIAFISLQGYAGESRDTKRSTDMNSFRTAIETKLAAGGEIMAFVSGSSAALSTAPNIAGTGTTTGTNYQAGTPNYVALGVKSEEFKDPQGQEYKIGATTAGGSRFETAASLENGGTRQALVKGTYAPRNPVVTADIVANSSNGKVLVLDSKFTNYFESGDTVDVTGSGAIADVKIVKVGSDGITLTFAADIASSSTTKVTLNAAESLGLIGARNALGTVVTTTGTNLPY